MLETGDTMKDLDNIIINVIILIFIIILKFIFLDMYPDKIMFANAIFWIILAFIMYKLKGIRKNKTELKKSSTSCIIIIILLYILLSFFSGLYFGFLKNSYSVSISSIIHNIYSIVIMIIAEEYIRSITIRNRNNKYNLILLTILYSVVDILILTNFSSINTNLKIFLFISGSLIPTFIRNILSSYIVFNFGLLPSIIYRIFFMIYPYIFPIYPDLGLYLNNIIAVIIPYLIYLLLSNLLNRYEHQIRLKVNKRFYLTTIPLVILLIIVVSLVSGVFRYKIISIASGSMEPYLNIGDAIIYENIDNYNVLDIGDVIVFRHDGIIVIHRIDSIEEKNNKRYFITKGDNNDNVDDYKLEEKDVLGIMRLKVKYIGLPALWFSEVFN